MAADEVFPVIIDTDPGIDDALALLLALGSQTPCAEGRQLKVEGLSIVCGNGCDARTLGANARLVLRLAGCEGVPVSLGEPKQGLTGATHVHGEDGMGNCAEKYERRPSDFEAFDARLPAEFIYQTCAAAPGQVTILCIGPLTNLAAALAAHPDLPALAKEVVVMGGAVGARRGNRTPTAEANFFDDPESAQAVLTAGFAKLVLAGLDVTHQTDVGVLREGCKEQLGEVPRARFIWDICEHYMEVYRGFGQSIAPAHDAVPAMYLVRPDLFTSQRVRVEVETAGSLTKGMSVADWKGQWGKEPNCEVLLTVDAEGFTRAFVSAISRL